MTFFLLSIMAMVGYAVQGTLIAHHVRRHDGLSVATIRNLSLIISMAPLLLLANSENFTHVPEYFFKFIAAGFTGATSLVLSLWALKFLPVGIKTALGRISSVILVFISGWIWFGEIPTLIEFAWVIPVIIGGTALATQKIKLSHLEQRTEIGILLTLLGVILSSLSFIQMSDIARDLDPFIAGYGWETSIGVWLALLGTLRWIFCAKPLFAKIKKPEIGKIALVSMPTVLGSGGFALAITMGPVGIASTIGTGGIFVSILIGHYLYQEKLTSTQWLWIGVCVTGLLGLGLLS